MPEPTSGGPAPASRVRRGARRRWGRLGVAALTTLVVVATGLWLASRGDGQDASPQRADGGSPDPATGAPRLLALSIDGGSAPYLAVLGTDAAGSGPAAMPIPQDLTMVVPGQGEATAAQVGLLDGPGVQVALSNEVGVWTEDYAVMDLGGLARLVERSGGLPVELAEPVVTTAGVLGPGKVSLTGVQTSALLRAEGGDPALRWADVLDGLLARSPSLEPSDVVSSSVLGSVQRTLTASARAQMMAVPVQTIAGTVTVAEQPAFDALVARTWGTAAPIPAIVQNGNGAPGVGQDVARAIIPAGFRVALSQNAQTFDVPVTEVIANGQEQEAAARMAHNALGIGRVQVSQVPSGIGDVTIVVGKDFTA